MIAAEWELRSDTLYLNHGSFGPPPRAVKAARAQWQQRLDRAQQRFLAAAYGLAEVQAIAKEDSRNHNS